MDILNHDIPLWVLVAWLVYSAAVQALPRPDSTAPGWYVWLYGFAHILAANVALAFDPQKKIPSPPK